MDPLAVTSTDPLTDLLNGVRTVGAVFNQSSLTGTWAARFEDRSPLAPAVLLRGSAWITPQGGAPVRIGPGDVVVLCGGAPYVIADDPATEPDVVIHPGGRCTTTQREETAGARVPDADTWDTARADSTLLLSGLCTLDSGTPSRLLAALPPCRPWPSSRRTRAPARSAGRPSGRAPARSPGSRSCWTRRWT